MNRNAALTGLAFAAATVVVAQPMLAQQVTGVIITGPCYSAVYNPSGVCVDEPTPQQRAEQKERDRKERERLERERIAREAREVEYRRKVDAQLAKMGGNPARRAEAERFVAMQQEAEAARARLARAKPKSCTARTWDQAVAHPGSTRDIAFAALNTSVSRRSGCSIGGNESVTSVRLASAANCEQRKLPQLKQPPVGNCFQCISQETAVLYGYIPGKGWPEPEIEWVCNATIACAAQKCGDGSGSKVTTQ